MVKIPLDGKDPLGGYTFIFRVLINLDGVFFCQRGLLNLTGGNSKTSPSEVGGQLVAISDICSLDKDDNLIRS